MTEATSSVHAGSQRRTGWFSGEGEELVDALIEACARKACNPKANPQLVGRELQPFAWDDALPASCKAPSSPSAGTPPSNKRKNSSPNNTRGRRNSVDSSSSSGNRRDSLEASSKRPNPKAPKHSNTPTAMQQGPPSTPIPIRTPATPAAAAHYACPAMFHSPKPEALPMPTSRLLMRASHAFEVIALPTCAVVA